MISEWIGALKNEDISETEKNRIDICSECTHNTKSVFLKFINKKVKEINGSFCNLCGCPLVAKIRSKKKCNKWEK